MYLETGALSPRLKRVSLAKPSSGPRKRGYATQVLLTVKGSPLMQPSLGS